MNWNTIHESERLRLWKNLRIAIKDLSLENQLNEIASFCSTIPTGPRTMDYYSPDDWPTPWEVLANAAFCTSSISLLMYYTLTLLNNPECNVALWLVKDNSNDYLLPVINDQFILNYELGKVSKYSDIRDYFIVMQQFSSKQVKTIT